MHPKRPGTPRSSVSVRGTLVQAEVTAGVWPHRPCPAKCQGDLQASAGPAFGMWPEAEEGEAWLAPPSPRLQGPRALSPPWDSNVLRGLKGQALEGVSFVLVLCFRWTERPRSNGQCSSQQHPLLGAERAVSPPSVCLSLPFLLHSHPLTGTTQSWCL
jgi:hypothetical protein